MGPKWVKKQVFFQFIGKFGKIYVPEIWAKMFSVNEIAEFFNQTYLQNKSMKYPDFLHVDINSHKLKVDQNLFGM